MTTCVTYPENTVNLSRTEYIACIPLKVECSTNNKIGLLTDAPWRCNKLCPTDKNYSNPYLRTDKICFQTQLLQTIGNRECPTTGWGDWINVEICDSNGSVVSVNIDDFACDYMVGWTGKHGIQNLKLDLSKPIFDDLKCWSIRIFTGAGENVKECFSQDFAEKTMCIEDTILIEACWNCSEDHEGAYYGDVVCWHGTSNFRYENKLRLCAKLKPNGSDGEIQDNEAGIAGKSIMKRYFRLAPNAQYGKHPAYIDAIMTNILTATGGVRINGEKYFTDAVARTNPSDSNCMFFNSWELYQSSEAICC